MHVYLSLIIPPPREGHLQLDLNRFVDVALPFDEVVHCLVVDDIGF
jgi:hypothetical protein